MDSDSFIQKAHLLLGISRQELARRVSSGQVDLQILKFQIERNSQEMQLETRCEQWIELKSLDQVDKFSAD